VVFVSFVPLWHSSLGGTAIIHQTRIRHINDLQPSDRGDYVLYWMQASQRAECNHALEYAIRQANGLGKPAVVFFGITDAFPEASLRHYRFMLEGLRETQEALARRGIRMVVRHESPETGVVKLARKACLLVMDIGYLRIQKQWRQRASSALSPHPPTTPPPHPLLPVAQVETDVIVPVEDASPKEEYAAATLRPKIHRKLDGYLVPLKETRPRVPSLPMKLASFDISETDAAMRKLRIDRSVGPAPGFTGGASHARRLLAEFIERKLARFATERNDPNADCLSNMSPYLHFGQISPLAIALQVAESGSPGMDAYLEELIVRRELSMNFVHYNPRYDSFSCLPSWVQRDLHAHAGDRREHVYTAEQLESAQTGDPLWNAAQMEMVCTGKMHGYLRMYWGKKIIEWSRTPEEAFAIALALNNKYELDGRDPNGFTGVAWCFGKHDRPWPPRPIFGKVRYMSEAGMRRKFDVEKYVEKIGEVCGVMR